MANALLDAIKQMKAKRVAIVVGDADELGLPDMVQGMDAESGEAPDDDPLAAQEDEQEAPEVPGEIPDAEDIAEGEAPEPGDAEQVMGRKPFDKNKPAGEASSGDASGIPDSVEQDVYDPEAAKRMQASGKKPNGLFARANMKLHEKFGKR